MHASLEESPDLRTIVARQIVLWSAGRSVVRPVVEYFPSPLLTREKKLPSSTEGRLYEIR